MSMYSEYVFLYVYMCMSYFVKCIIYKIIISVLSIKLLLLLLLEFLSWFMIV